MKPSLLLLSIASALLAGCSDSDSPLTPNTPQQPDFVSVEKAVSIDAGTTYQTMRGFGASDCWTADYVGQYWTRQRDAISELLFSTDIADGRAKGIGLSQWRVNLGGGTAAQGDASGIDDKTRRAASFLTGTGQYDWNNCRGQQYFMQRAKDMGCPSFVLFSNTPPVQFTRNGKGFSASGACSNLKEDAYDDFADYLATVAQHYLHAGYPVTHLSPVNEPQYNWDSGQEGSGWQNSEVARLIRELDRALTDKQADVTILPGEAGDWEYLYKTKGDATRSNVIADFFTPSSADYIGNLKHTANLLCGHSYWTDGTWNGMRKVRQQVAAAAQAKDIELWQSEWSMLGDGYSSEEFVGYDKATEIDIALYMSKVIHNDLTQAGVGSWSFWTSMDVPRWGHQNRFLLIALTPAGGENGDLAQEGSYRPTATLWVLGNYSRFIRPGYVRIRMDYNESRHFFASAWMSPDKKEIVAVYTNLTSDKGIRLSETHTGWQGKAASVRLYTTTARKQLAESSVSPDGPVVLEPMSVTTVVYQLN